MRNCYNLGAVGLALIGASGAYAADLPSKKAAPAEYVQVCSVHGVGFFYIPGTDTCLKISGFLRATYIGMNVGNNGNLTPYKGPLSGTTQSSRSQNVTGFAVRAATNFDIRSTTPYGTLRAYMKLYWNSTSGANPLPGYLVSQTALIKFSFVQWAGLTAGRAQSMFDFYADDLGQDNIRGPDKIVNMLAYTATFGNGFSATLSLEDSQSTGTVPTIVGTAKPTAYAYQGTRQPDVVANIRVDQSWGAAQLAGIYNVQNVEASSDVGAWNKSVSGWGVLGGVQIKLPMIGPGDYFWLQGVYTKGVLSRQTQGFARGWEAAGSNQSNGLSTQNGWVLPDYDTVVVNNSAKLPVAYSGVFAFKHNWSAAWSSNIEVGYLNVKYPSAATGSANTWALASNWNEWRVGAGTYWTPVTNLTFGADLYWTHLNQKAPVFNGVPFAGTPEVPFKKVVNNYEGLLRVERDF